MIEFFTRIYDFLSRRRALATCLLLLLVVGMAALALRLHYEEDIARFLPKNSASARAQEIYGRFAESKRVAVFVESTDTLADNEDEIEAALLEMGEALEASGRTEHLTVEMSEESTTGAFDYVCQNLPLLADAADYARMDSLLAQPDYAREQLQAAKQWLLLPTGGTMMRTLPYDPLNLFGPVLQRAREAMGESGFTVENGFLHTADGKRAMLFFDSPYGGSETAQNGELAAMLDSLIAATQTAHPGLRASAIGAPLIAVSNASQIKRDALPATAAAVVLIFALLLWHYRSLRKIAWLLASIAIGMLFALACFRLLSGNISIIVLGIGSVIIGIAANYPLHFLDHIEETPDSRTALREMVAPLLIGNITTVAAFACLVWLDAAAMRDLGLFGALSLVGTILFVLIFLPLYAQKGRRGMRTIDLDRLAPNRPLLRDRTVAAIVLVGTLILGWFSLKTSFDSNLQNINYMSPAQKADLEVLSSTLDSGDLYAVAEGATADAALAANDSLCALLRTADEVEGVSGLGALLPSQARQRQNLAARADFIERHGAKMLADFRSACRAEGFDESAFEPFFAMWEGDVEPLGESDVEALLESDLASRFVVKGDGKVSLQNFVRTTDEARTKARINTDGAASQFAFSAADMGRDLVQTLNNSFNYIGFVCGFVVFFFLWLSFGSLEIALLSFLPLAVGWIWILGTMQLFGIQFNIVNIILATFIFGQGDDYTIFITEGLLAEHATGKRRLGAYKSSVAISAILMFVGIGVLIFAKHPALRSLAQITIIGMLTVVVMAYVLPGIVFRWITRKKGAIRAVPLTLKRLGRSLFALLYFLVMMFGLLVPFTWIYFKFGKTTEKKRLRYHTILQRSAHFVARHIPGVKMELNNAAGETFERPAVLVCNHQSHLDLMCLMMLTPKIIFLTNEWAWNNPLYSLVIHKAEFYPVREGIDELLPKLQNLYQRGYTIALFPEGTRTLTGEIGRFHKGATYLARQLGADILPVFLHGCYHVLPKKDFMLREGSIYVEIGERRRVESADELAETKALRHYYLDHYDEIRDRRETAHYFASYVRHQFLYKGLDVWRHCKQTLKANDDYAAEIEAVRADSGRVDIAESGQGEKALLYALALRRQEIYARLEGDADAQEVARALANIPKNLHWQCDETASS